VRGSVYCTASFSICSLRRTKFPIIYPDLRLDYKVATHPFRSDLRLMYLPAMDPLRGKLVEARLVPMRVARFRLNRGTEADAEWLCGLLNRLGVPLGTRGELAPDHTLTLHPFT
jgi:hypothetical protein